MSIQYTDTNSSIECLSLELRGVAHIWKNGNFKGSVFVCGDFSIEDLVEIVNKAKEYNKVIK